MEKEFNCKYLGENIGLAQSLMEDGWPLYECEAPEDATPSFAGKASYEDGSVRYYCRLATSIQQKCSEYKQGEETGIINLINKA